MQDQKEPKGIMLGLLAGEDDLPRIAIQIGDQRAILPIGHAGLVFDQLGDLLAACGWFGDEEDDNEMMEGVQCH